MKRIKQRVSIVICLSLLLGIMQVFPVRAASNPYPAWNDDARTIRSCTSIAWQKVYESYGVAIPSNWGNAGSWYDSARNAGYPVGGTPAKGSLAVWTGGRTGHVAYVLDVDSSSNGIYVYEGGNSYSYGKPGVGSRWIYNGDEGSGKRLVGFIYFSGSSSNNSHTVQILEAKTAGQDDGGYMMYCKVDDESAVRSIQCASWANAGGTAEAKTQDMARVEQNIYKLYVSYNLFRSEATVFYNDINITSHNGQVTRATMIVNSKKNKNPVIQSVEMAGEDNDGYMVACRVDDDLLVRSIKIATWTDVGTNIKAIFQPMVLMEKNLYKYYVPYKDHDAKSTIYYNDIYITAVNDNEVKYATLVKKRGSGSSGTVTPVSTIKPTTTASPSPKPSSDPKVSATPKPSASVKPTVSGKPIGTDSPDKTPTPASGDSDHAAVPSPTPVLFGDGITIQFTKSVYKLDIDETMYLSYSISPEEAPDIDMVWSSSDESIVSVDDDGMVTAHDYGSVLITVKNSSSAATCSVRVTVQPSGTKIKKIKGTKEGFSVRWTKVRDVDGYQVSYSTSDGFRKSKSRTIKKSSSYKASDLDRRKKYYIRIRTYVKVDDKLIYSEWSKTKTVRTR